jgi:hypothetical protein
MSARAGRRCGSALRFGFGADFRLSSRAIFVIDAKWNTLRVDIEDFGITVPLVEIDPLSLAIGLGLSFRRDSRTESRGEVAGPAPDRRSADVRVVIAPAHRLPRSR